MVLSVSDIKERLKKKGKAQTISKAIKHENRIRFHVESFIEPSDISQPLTVFLDWVKTLIPEDKYNIFVSLFKFPVPTVQLTNSIFTELEKVFEGRNPFSDFKFTDAELKADWEQYRNEQLKEPLVWRKKGWDSVRTAINSVLVIDLPSEQTTELPEPYFYWLGVENVIDYELKGISEFECLIFKQPGGKIAVFDDNSIRVFKLTENNTLPDEPEIENEHGLGYCPSRFFWSEELTQHQKDIKKFPISAQLANLDWLLFFAISKRQLDLYAPYPIYSSYEADCDYANNETGDYCDGGFLRGRDQNYRVLRDGTIEPCPVCASKRLAGAGSFIEVPVPNGNDPDLRDPVSITPVDKDSLDYNVEEVNRLASEIFTRTVGIGGDVHAKQSINEMQVTANFESRTNVLNSLKGNLEAIQKFTDETVCRLRYGDKFLSGSISLGTEFYIYTVDDLYKRYQQAKENGASETELDAINNNILATEYRNNPAQLQRMQILKQLEPYRHYTQQELISLKRENLLDETLLKIKINFSTFVERFERENIDVAEFGSQLDFDKKINIITEKFKQYVEEQRERPGAD